MFLIFEQHGTQRKPHGNQNSIPNSIPNPSANLTKTSCLQSLLRTRSCKAAHNISSSLLCLHVHSVWSINQCRKKTQ